MKKVILALIVLISASTFAQKSDAPAAAKAAFAKAFPSATNIKWDKEDGAFEADFELKGKKMAATFDAKGVFQESEIAIQVSELPASVTAYMKGHYKGIAVKEAAKITKPNGAINYEAAIKGKDVLFDANGKFIKEAKD